MAVLPLGLDEGHFMLSLTQIIGIPANSVVMSRQESEESYRVDVSSVNEGELGECPLALTPLNLYKHEIIWLPQSGSQSGSTSRQLIVEDSSSQKFTPFTGDMIRTFIEGQNIEEAFNPLTREFLAGKELRISRPDSGVLIGEQGQIIGTTPISLIDLGAIQQQPLPQQLPPIEMPHQLNPIIFADDLCKLSFLSILSAALLLFSSAVPILVPISLFVLGIFFFILSRTVITFDQDLSLRENFREYFSNFWT